MSAEFQHQSTGTHVESNGFAQVFSQKWLVLYAVMAGGFMVSVDGSAVNLVLPTLVKALNTDFAMVQWVVVSYLLTITTLIIIMARLGDLIGNKGVYLSGFLLFTLGSLLCPIAGSVEWLIGFRVVQGIGGAMILALGFAVATGAFSPSERGKAMGILASVVSLGVVAGPVIGGFLVKYLSWHWIFFMNLPLGAFGIYMVGRYVPATPPNSLKGEFDIPGAVLFFLSMFFLLMGLTISQGKGLISPIPIVAFVMSLIFLVLFVQRQIRARSPLVNPDIFKNMRLSANIVVLFLFYFVIGGIFVLAPFFFQDTLGLLPDQIGLLFGVMSITMAAASPVAGILSDRMGTSAIILMSLLVILGTFTLMAIGISPATSIPACMVSMILIGLGMGLYMSPSHSAVMGAVSKEHLGVVSGLIILGRTLGQTAGVAVLGAAWAGWVRHYNNGVLEKGITDAPIFTRIHGFQNIAYLCAALVLIALVVMVWGINQNRRQHP